MDRPAARVDDAARHECRAQQVNSGRLHGDPHVEVRPWLREQRPVQGFSSFTTGEPGVDPIRHLALSEKAIRAAAGLRGISQVPLADADPGVNLNSRRAMPLLVPAYRQGHGEGDAWRVGAGGLQHPVPMIRRRQFPVKLGLPRHAPCAPARRR